MAAGRHRGRRARARRRAPLVIGLSTLTVATGGTLLAAGSADTAPRSTVFADPDLHLSAGPWRLAAERAGAPAERTSRSDHRQVDAAAPATTPALVATPTAAAPVAHPSARPSASADGQVPGPVRPPAAAPAAPATTSGSASAPASSSPSGAGEPVEPLPVLPLPTLQLPVAPLPPLSLASERPLLPL